MKLKKNTLKFRRQNYKYLDVYSKTGLIFILFLLAMVILGSIVEARRTAQEAPMISPLFIGPMPKPEGYVIPKEETRWYRLYKIVRWYESNNGKTGLAVTCAKKGLINEIGYLPYKGFCFQTRGDQESTFANWINKRFNYDGLNETQLLCLWNEGKIMDNCHYAQGNLAKAK